MASQQARAHDLLPVECSRAILDQGLPRDQQLLASRVGLSTDRVGGSSSAPKCASRAASSRSVLAS
jgi:hypothetical protein